MILRQKLSAYWRLMRFDKPIGTLLLLWPTLWSLWLSATGLPPLKILFIFVAGVIIMRAAGCIINDIADRDIDPHVERTQARPLAAKEIQLSEAIILLLLMSCIAFVLVLQLNILCIKLAFIAMGLTLIYPFCKRFLPTPQVVLSLAFAFGVLMSDAAINNHISIATWILYLASCCWIAAFDTAYAMSDREDDIKVGIHSTALLLADYDCLFIVTLEVCFIIGLLLVGILKQLSWIYYAGVFCSAILFTQQYQRLKTRDKNQCFSVFLSNNWVGMAVFIAILMSLCL